MKTTLILSDELLERAREATGLKDKTALVHDGLEALIAREAAWRLASLGGTEHQLRAITRRHSRRLSGTGRRFRGMDHLRKG